MAELFGHEKLIVYQKGMRFGIAYKAAIQSSALVDLAVVGASAAPSRVEEGRKLLRRIAAMLTSLSRVASDEN